MRHSDYHKLFEEIGFDPVFTKHVSTPVLFEVADEFKDYSIDDMGSTTGFYVLRKKKC